MRTFITVAALTTCVCFMSQAQESLDVAGAARAYSQAQSAENGLSLDLVAVNTPDALVGLGVRGADEQEIGTVTAVMRNAAADHALQVVVELEDGTRAALPVAELTLAALMYYDPAQSLGGQLYDETQFERVSQYQAGHSAQGSLASPATDESSSADTTGTVVAQSSQTQLERTQTPDQSAPGSIQDAPYDASGSVVVQFALTNPDALRSKQLLDEAGAPLGEINHIAKNSDNQMLYAVIDMNDQHERTAVKLDALRIGKLGYAGNASTLQQFDEGSLVPVTPH